MDAASGGQYRYRYRYPGTVPGDVGSSVLLMAAGGGGQGLSLSHMRLTRRLLFYSHIDYFSSSSSSDEEDAISPSSYNKVKILNSTDNRFVQLVHFLLCCSAHVQQSLTHSHTIGAQEKRIITDV